MHYKIWQRDRLTERYDVSNIYTNQFLIAGRLAMWNIAQKKTSHEAEVLGTELVAVVQIQYVLLAHAAFYRRRHFDHRARLCHTPAYHIMHTVTTVADGHTHAHTRLTALCPGLPGWASTRKTKPIWILLKQETASGSGISWAICKSAPCSRQVTTPVPHHSRFLQAGCPSCRQTNSAKALKARYSWWTYSN